MKAVEQKPQKCFLALFFERDIRGDVREISGQCCAGERVADVIKAFNEVAAPYVICVCGPIKRHFRVGKKLGWREKRAFQAFGASCKNRDSAVVGGKHRHDFVVIADGRFSEDDAAYGFNHEKASFPQGCFYLSRRASNEEMMPKRYREARRAVRISHGFGKSWYSPKTPACRRRNRTYRISRSGSMRRSFFSGLQR